MQQFANSLPRLADIVSSSRSARHSRPTGTGDSDAPSGAVSAAVVKLEDRGDRIIAANTGELILADSPGHVFVSPGRGTGERLALPARRRAVFPAHAGRCVPIAGSGRPLQDCLPDFHGVVARHVLCRIRAFDIEMVGLCNHAAMIAKQYRDV